MDGLSDHTPPGPLLKRGEKRLAKRLHVQAEPTVAPEGAAPGVNTVLTPPTALARCIPPSPYP